MTRQGVDRTKALTTTRTDGRQFHKQEVKQDETHKEVLFKIKEERTEHGPAKAD